MYEGCRAGITGLRSLASRSDGSRDDGCTLVHDWCHCMIQRVRETTYTYKAGCGRVEPPRCQTSGGVTQGSGVCQEAEMRQGLASVLTKGLGLS